MLYQILMLLCVCVCSLSYFFPKCSVHSFPSMTDTDTCSHFFYCLLVLAVPLIQVQHLLVLAVTSFSCCMFVQGVHFCALCLFSCHPFSCMRQQLLFFFFFKSFFGSQSTEKLVLASGKFVAVLVAHSIYQCRQSGEIGGGDEIMENGFGHVVKSKMLKRLWRDAR